MVSDLRGDNSCERVTGYKRQALGDQGSIVRDMTNKQTDRQTETEGWESELINLIEVLWEAFRTRAETPKTPFHRLLGTPCFQTRPGDIPVVRHRITVTLSLDSH